MVELVYAQEPLTPELAAELYPIAKEWWETRSDVPFDPEMTSFFVAHLAGDLRVYTLREEEKLVGCAIYVLSVSLFTQVLRAQSVSVMLIPGQRVGWNGYKFINYCVGRLLKENVLEVTMDTTETIDLSKLYERAGFSKNLTEYIRRA